MTSHEEPGEVVSAFFFFKCVCAYACTYACIHTITHTGVCEHQGASIFLSTVTNRVDQTTTVAMIHKTTSVLVVGLYANPPAGQGGIFFF